MGAEEAGIASGRRAIVISGLAARSGLATRATGTIGGFAGPAGPGVERVHQLLCDGAAIGRINPLPKGGWGLPGWIALLNPDERRALVITADPGRPRTHGEPGEAQDTLHRSYRERPAPAAPRLALKRPTSWSAPSARGLGTPHRSQALGEDPVHLTWPGAPGVQELQHEGRPVGRIELYDVERGTWVALIDSRIVTNAASSEPLRCATSADAPALLRPALGRHLTW